MDRNKGSLIRREEDCSAIAHAMLDHGVATLLTRIRCPGEERLNGGNLKSNSIRRRSTAIRPGWILILISLIIGATEAFAPASSVTGDYLRGGPSSFRTWSVGRTRASPSAVVNSPSCLNAVSNTDGRVQDIPSGSTNGLGNEPYLQSITGSVEEQSVKRNKVKLREAISEVKEAAREVKEKSSKLKDKVKGETDEAPILAGEDLPSTTQVVQEVTESVGKLGYTAIKKSPSILARLSLLVVSAEMRKDFNRRKGHYLSDWVDGFKSKRQTVPAILFLYFACLSPAVSFGTISSQLTNGAIGVVEFVLSCGCSGMAYSILCGQPMAFIAPTGLTLAFISGLFRFCSVKGIAFFPVYAWVGLWTSLFMICLGMVGSSRLIRYCTRFTDEVFNSLLSLNFTYEAVSSLRRNFLNVPNGKNLTMPFVALTMALSTFFAMTKAIGFQTTKFFNQSIRNTVKNFGPVGVFLTMSAINQIPSIKRFNLPTLSVPTAFELSGGRDFLIPLTTMSWKNRLLCSLPAVLLTALFYMDQNISVRVINNPDNKLKKGAAYNIDMVALGVITGVLSLFGLPWMCGATVQSMNHLKAMTTTKFNDETGEAEIESVTETRVTGFFIHYLIASTVKALALLKYLPIPVVSGVFLYLGRKLMIGNSFIERLGDGFAEKTRLPKDHPINLLGRKKMNLFTTLQVLCLVGLWTFKSNPATAIFFPSVIGMLIALRGLVIPRFFTEDELVALGDPSPKRSKAAEAALEANPEAGA